MKKLLILLIMVVVAGVAFADAPVDGLMLGVDIMVWDEAPSYGVAFDVSPMDMPFDVYGAVGVTEPYAKLGVSFQPGKNNDVIGFYLGGGIQINKSYVVTTETSVETVCIPILWWTATDTVSFTDGDTYFDGYRFKPIGEVGVEIDFKIAAVKLGYTYYAGEHLANVGFLLGW